MSSHMPWFQSFFSFFASLCTGIGWVKVIGQRRPHSWCESAILELLAPASLLHSPLHKDKMNTVQLPGEREIPGGGREFTCRKRRYWLAVIN